MKNDFIRLNIALKPPKFVAEKAIGLSRKLGRKFKYHFVLDDTKYHPHITVYSPEYPVENLEKILEAVRIIAEETKKMKVRGDGFEAKQGFVGVRFDLTDEIREFHKKVVAALNPLRENHLREKYEAADYKMKLSPEKIENIRKYGYPSAMSLYNPHLTIIRLTDEKKAEEISENMKWDIPEFEVRELGVYKMGDHGICKELVQTFELI